MNKTKTMLRGESDAETCRLNGWGPGTMLMGEECGAITTLLITAVGERLILARAVKENGRKCNWPEMAWTLAYREWRRVQ